MSQTATAAAPPPSQPAQAQAAAAPAAPTAGRQPAYVDTPSLLNRWQLIGMTAAVVFGILSALVQFISWQADGRAADDAEQLVRVQEIQSSLLRADALATNAFLVGGLEDPDQRADYDASMKSVLTTIADAADAQSADRAALAALNVAVNDYATAVAQARDNNRQGYPVGAEYLRGASTDLRADAIPVLDALVKANNDRAKGSMAGQHPFWLLFIGLVAFAVLVWINRQLARHFRRRINSGVAVAAIIVAVVSIVTAGAAFARDSSNDDLLSGDYRTAVVGASTRTAANDAKANESLRLIARGSGSGYEKNWQQAAEQVDRGFARQGTIEVWRTYVERHNQIVELDTTGEWEKAVHLATRIDAEGSTAPLDTVDADLAKTVADASSSTTDALRSGRPLALIVSALSLLFGIAGAIAVARGIGQRRKEFA